jgi:hypothetical protein
MKITIEIYDEREVAIKLDKQLVVGFLQTYDKNKISLYKYYLYRMENINKNKIRKIETIK